MKAVVVHKQGSPEVLTNEQVVVPEPNLGEVLIKVYGCAINHLDIWLRSMLPGVTLPIILGCDIAGEIAKVGAGVANVELGQKVLVYPGLSCGTCKVCIAGQENLCPQYHILGAGRDGGYAEYVSVPAINCFPIPSGLSFHQAAAIPLVFLTAWHMLIRRAQIKPGETILIIGGSSGVGSAALQIAKLFHCEVIATVGDDAKAQPTLELGANHIIFHSKQSILAEVNKLTNKRGVDVVFEHVGPAVFTDCLNSLAINGRLVTCGATTGTKVEIDLSRLFMKHQTILGSVMGTRAELAELLPFFAQRLLKPVVHDVFPLSEARAAHEVLESRKHFGKVVLDPTV